MSSPAADCSEDASASARVCLMCVCVCAHLNKPRAHTLTRWCRCSRYIITISLPLGDREEGGSCRLPSRHLGLPRRLLISSCPRVLISSPPRAGLLRATLCSPSVPIVFILCIYLFILSPRKQSSHPRCIIQLVTAALLAPIGCCQISICPQFADNRSGLLPENRGTEHPP